MSNTRFLGFAGEETGGSSAVKVVFREGSATGNIIGVLNLAAGGADSRWLGPQGVLAQGGIYAVVGTGGTCAGSVLIG